MKLQDLLHGMRMYVDVDDDDVMRVNTELTDGSVLRMTRRAPQSEEQLSAMMQTLAREIWQHHLRQRQHTEAKHGDRQDE